MRIATRLTLLFVFLSIVVSFSVGWFAVAMSSRAQYATLDGTINAVVDSGLHNPNTALSNALYVAQQNGYDVTLDVVFASGSTTNVFSAGTPLTRHPTREDVDASRHHVVEVATLPGFRIRSLNVGGGDYLVVAAPTAGIVSQNRHLALLVAIAALIVAGASLGLARSLTRRDLHSMARLIDYAEDVATGQTSGPTPTTRGSRDLQELRAALVTMVNALHERIDAEARDAQVMQQFIDDASHELRTPLTVVKGYNELLARGEVTAEQRERALTRVQREVERMESLVSDLLLLAQVREAPHHSARIIDLSERLHQRMADFSIEQSARALRVSIEEDVRVRARPDFLDRLINNALTNISRHTGADVAVAVTLRCAGEWVELDIEDAGPGLPVYGERPRRFHRFDQSRSRETGGSGLGMSIMADVAEALGGSMTTSPSSLGGLALRFRLPAPR